MSRLLRTPWFPYVFALSFPISVYSRNVSAFAMHEVFRPALVMLVASIALVAILRLLLRRSELPALLATAAVLGLWLLGVRWELLAVFVLIGLLSVILAKRQMPAALTPVLNALSLGVLLTPVVSILNVERVVQSNDLERFAFSPFVAAIDTAEFHHTPDIYHIVLDAYTSEDVLREEMGFDNRPFFDALRERGFHVNDSVMSPYNETVHVMSSMFLGEYLVPGEFPIDSIDPPRLRSTLGSVIVNSPVHELLRRNDYEIVYTDTGHDFLRFPDHARVLYPDEGGTLNRFELHLGIMTALARFFPGQYELTLQNPLISSVKRAFEYDYSEFAGPKFVYQHVIAPHTPFIIDRHGELSGSYPGFVNTTEGDRVVWGMPERQALYVDGYLEKLRYVNSELLPQLDRLLSDPAEKVIIVHGDHGSGSKYYMDSPEKTCLKERFSTFMAVFSNVPEIRERFAWVESSDATPVNLYRSLLSAIANFDLDELPRETAFIKYGSPHDPIPVAAEHFETQCGPVAPLN